MSGVTRHIFVGTAGKLAVPIKFMRSHDDTIIIDMATVSEEDIDEAITSATQKLGYRELCPNQELAVRHFLRGHTFSFPFRQAVARVSAVVFFRRRLIFFARALKALNVSL